MLTQSDDDGQEFVVVYANQSNNKTKAKYNSYEGEYFAVVLVIFFLGVIYTIAHLLLLPITSP